MKLVRKLTTALLLAMTVVLALYGYLSASQEQAFLEGEVERHQKVMGNVLALAMGEVISTSGDGPAQRLMETVDRNDPAVRLRWLGREVQEGQEGEGPTGLSAHRHVTMVPIVGPKGVAGRLEISESLESEDNHVRATVWRTAITTLALAILGGGLAALLGGVLVGRPIQALADKARRIGQGDLGGPLVLAGGDELGFLAGEMNAMCERLSAARVELDKETAAKSATLDQLRHADRLNTVGKLASGIAHELGTPLNVVVGRAKMIARREVAGEDAVSNAGIIVEQVDRMIAIIRQLLDFARRRRAEKASADLSQVAAQTVGLLRPLAQKRGVTIAPPTGEGRAAVHVGQIQQVLTNLVMNAAHASPQGSSIEVEVGRVRRAPPPEVGGGEADFTTLAVQDHGTGIGPDHLPHVFEPFFTTKDVGEGTGLGLSVAFGIVQDHGGFIEVQSELGRGSRFTIHLPAEG